MATHDYVIANQGFPAFRSDLNDALAAIVSNNSSATEPTTMFAHMIWVDTAANPSIIKIRNADNDAWITIGSIDQTGDTFTLVNLRTSGPVVFNDAGADVDFRVEGDTNANLLFVDASADAVGIGTSSPSFPLDVVSNASSNALQLRGRSSDNTSRFELRSNDAATHYGTIFAYNNVLGIEAAQASGNILFNTNSAERMRITSAGAVGIGTTSPGTTLSVNGTMQLASGVHNWINAVGAAPNAAATNYSQYGHNVTGRGISSGGSINASGTDYAEYMTKAGDFELAKGDICGINSDGKLTNVFADAVAFLVKSTNPSYVGGDIWGNEDAVGKKPVAPFQREAEVDEEGNETQAAETDEDFAARQAQYEVELAEFEAKLEAERQKVDRIAFSGQVPVNVTGATAGQYIVPVESNGGITGVAVNEADMTLAQYMKAVGKVIAIEEDGRARIIVKVA